MKRTKKGYYFFLKKKDYKKYKDSKTVRLLIRLKLLKRYHIKAESNQIFRKYFLIKPNYYYLGYVTNPIAYHLLSLRFRSIEVMYLEASDSEAFKTVLSYASEAVLSSTEINGGFSI